MAQMAVNDVPNFSGEWKLRTSENLDEFLKAEGWGFIKRKAAAGANSTQIIVQTDKSIKLTVKNIKGEYVYEAPLDGKTKITYKDMDKEEVTSTTKVSDDGQKIIEEMIKGKAKKQMRTERYMENNEMKLKITNVAKGHYCIRIFAKKK